MTMQIVHARMRAILVFLAVFIATYFAAAAPATAAQFDLMLTTSRGCIEDGDHPVYAVGETITVTFRVGSATVSSAATSLFDVLSDGRVGVISFGTIATNQTRQFTARIGPPTGVEKLILQADAFAVERTRKPCSFTVVSGTPAITRTPTPTRTVGSMTPTPSGALSAHVRTQRGCLETGDNATFAIGEQIVVSYRLNSATIGQARATLADIQPNGLVKIFDFGTIPTNITFAIAGAVGPPSGTKILQLRGKATGVPTAIANCSFRVTGTAPPTPTRAATRTKTATRTATPTKTPIPNTPCVGACTTPGTVTISDVAIVAQIASGQLPLNACPSADPDHNGIVTLAEVMQAVNNAINGC